MAQKIKNLPANAGDLGSIPGLGRSPGGGHGNPLQYSCLENPMDRGTWWATVHGVTKSRTQLRLTLSFSSYLHIPESGVLAWATSRNHGSYWFSSILSSSDQDLVKARLN